MGLEQLDKQRVQDHYKQLYVVCTRGDRATRQYLHIFDLVLTLVTGEQQHYQAQQYIPDASVFLGEDIDVELVQLDKWRLQDKYKQLGQPAE